MSRLSALGGNLGAHIELGKLGRFIPEPGNRLLNGFRQVLGGLGQASGISSAIDPSYQDLLNRQIETQIQMQAVSLESNIEKSKHETQMAAIRNIRVG